MHSFKHTLCLIAVLLLAFACSKNDKEEITPEEDAEEKIVNASFTVVGEENIQKEGKATYFLTQIQDTPLVIGIDDGGQGDRSFSLNMYFMSEEKTYPEPGEYVIGEEGDPDADFYVIYIEYVSGGDNRGYKSPASGTIIIDQVSASQIKGTFNFEAGAMDNSGRNVKVENGVFDAFSLS
ncbi:hypothetical protein RCC89_09450 [Cytophagaceae bacterium ABcell3]|nr:hypothetical protein RCC89_09450 [Cytophagaceae bacterium ABcell3]